MTLRVVDLSGPPQPDDDVPPGVQVAVGPIADAAESWLDRATFTLTEEACDDRRVVVDDSVPDALADLPKSNLVDRSDLNALLAGLCGQN